MAYSTPSPEVTGALITAAKWNQNIVDNILSLRNPDRCRVTHNVAQSVANNAFTALAFNTDIYDTASLHDVSTNNSRITVSQAGTWRVFGEANFASSPSNGNVSVRLNGATYIGRSGSEGNTVTTYAVGFDYEFATSDYIELMAFQDSGGAINVASASAYSPIFGATFVGATS